MTEIEQKKTGTTIVGLVAKDCVILASDRRMSLGGRIVAKKDIHKTVKVLDNLALSFAGTVSDVQMAVKVIKAQLKLLHLRRGKPANVKEAVNLLGNMLYGNIRRSFMMPSIAAFIAGGYDEEGAHLYEVSPDGVVLEYKDYLADGSGMLFATGVLEANYKPGMSKEEAIKVVTQAVKASIERDTASGNGIDIFAITKNGVENVYENAIEIKV